MKMSKPLAAATLLVSLALCGHAMAAAPDAAAPVPAAAAVAPESPSKVIEDGGSGPYKAVAIGEASLPGFTIYRPQDLAAFSQSRKLPVVLWGNGAASNNNTGYKNFLGEIASHGFVVIAIGPYELLAGPNAGLEAKRTTSLQLLQALDWITAQNTLEGSVYKDRIDLARVCAMGHSLGGLQALEVSTDPRITATVLCNSGVFKGGPPAAIPAIKMPAVTKQTLDQLHGPIMYLMGGPSDIAYSNGADDFALITKVPAVWASQDVGHGGTYGAPHGGPYGVAAVAWIKWQLQGDTEAAAMFVGGEDSGLCKADPKWKVQVKNLNGR